MPAVKVTDLKNQATQILRTVEQGKEYVVTKRGRPIAVILPVADEDLEDWVLAHHPEALRRREAAEARIAAGDFATASDLRAVVARAKREPRSRR